MSEPFVILIGAIPFVVIFAIIWLAGSRNYWKRVSAHWQNDANFYQKMYHKQLKQCEAGNKAYAKLIPNKSPKRKPVKKIIRKK